MMALTAFKVVTAVAGGISNYQKQMGDAARLDSEARLADTQALQRDAASRDELDRFLSGTSAARAANGLSANSPNALKLASEANRVYNSERMIQTSGDRQRAANLRAGAKSLRKSAKLSLLTGVVSGGIPLAQSQI